MQNIRVAKYLFFTVSFFNLLGIAFKEPLLVYTSKPFIISALWLLYKFQTTKTNYFYSVALIFSLVGDIVLMFKGLNFFMLGLVSFLIAQVFYILIVSKRIKNYSFSKMLKLSIPFMLLVIGLITLLESKGLEAMLFPLIMYGITIGVFGTVALYSHLELKNEISKFMLFGALLFITSDALLAINSFYEPMHVLNLIVMITYIGAQYFIYKSMVQVEANAI